MTRDLCESGYPITDGPCQKCGSEIDDECGLARRREREELNLLREVNDELVYALENAVYAMTHRYLRIGERISAAEKLAIEQATAAIAKAKGTAP